MIPLKSAPLASEGTANSAALDWRAASATALASAASAFASAFACGWGARDGA